MFRPMSRTYSEHPCAIDGEILPQPHFCRCYGAVVLYVYTMRLRAAARFARQGMCYSHTRAACKREAKMGRGIRCQPLEAISCNRSAHSAIACSEKEINFLFTRFARL